MINKILSTGSCKPTSRCDLNQSQTPESMKNTQIPDTFEITSSPLNNENNNLKFKKEVLKFYPEDEEKMAKMPLYQRIAYRRKLKEQHKYIIVDENNDRTNIKREE